MAEVIGLTASILGIIEITAKITKLCMGYSTNVKNARDDIDRIKKDVESLMAIITQVKLLVNGPDGSKFQALRTLHDGINDFLCCLVTINLYQLENSL